MVHDWLYSYVYQDGLWLVGGRARGAAMLGVFLVSAVVHEYIFCFVLGFFYPVMLMLFLVFGGYPGQPVLPGVVCTEALPPAPDNLLGTGDTSILVLSYLEARALSLPT